LSLETKKRENILATSSLKVDLHQNESEMIICVFYLKLAYTGRA